jgi:hypothetical protein
MLKITAQLTEFYMAGKDEYSKDPNHNDQVEIRENRRYLTIFIVAFSIIAALFFYYYYFVFEPPVKLYAKPIPAKIPTPIPTDPDVAKPYDSKKPPYEQ